MHVKGEAGGRGGVQDRQILNRRGDEHRLARLVERYGGGDRSSFLRAAIAHMEVLDRAERLRELQAYGAHRAASRDT